LFTSCTVWSADATHVACDGESKSNPSANGIYRIRSSDGGGLTRITDAGGGIAVLIDYSLDGNRMVFGRRGPDFECTKRSALFVVNVDGSLSGSKRCSDYAAALSYSWMSPSSTSRGRTFFRRTFAGSNLGSGSSRSTPRCGLARL
jgi:hypothetical protein